MTENPIVYYLVCGRQDMPYLDGACNNKNLVLLNTIEMNRWVLVDLLNMTNDELTHFK